MKTEHMVKKEILNFQSCRESGDGHEMHSFREYVDNAENENCRTARKSRTHRENSSKPYI